MKKLRLQIKRVKSNLFKKMIVTLINVTMMSFATSIVFGAELLVVDDTMHQYIDKDESDTINLGDQIILDNELFNIMIEKDGVVYALADKPLNSSGDKQDGDNLYKTRHGTAKEKASIYHDTLVKKGIDVNSTQLLTVSQAQNWLFFKFDKSTGNPLNDIYYTYYKTSDATPEFAYKYVYWLYNSQTYSNKYYLAYQYSNSTINNYYSEGATVLPVVALNTNCFGRQFKISSDDTGVSVSNINGDIYIQVASKTGYVLDTLKAYDSNRNEIEIIDNKLTMIKDDITIETTYKEVFTVTFNTNGGSNIASIENVVSGDRIEEPTAPTKENYTFAGWYKDEDLQNTFDFATDTITTNTTLHAKWEEEQLTMYEIVVSATPIAGGTVKGEATYEANELVTVEATANNGYTFVKWTENGVEVSTSATYTFMADENKTLVAVFEGIPQKIIVTFDSNGGSNVDSYEFECFGVYPQIPKPANPIRTGYTFNGWYKDGIEFDFNTTVTESITLVAKWTKNQSTGGGGGGSTVTKYKISVKQNENGKISPETIKVKKGANQKFEIKADKGYVIEDVLIDGKSIGVVKEYTFKKVKEKHTIEAIFTPIKIATEDVWKNPFVDVNENDWFYNTVRFVNENKLFNGISNTEFGGNVSMTRGMLLSVLYRIEGEPAINKSIPFADVDMSVYYASAISWAKQNSIVNGVDENNFAPDVQISREQLTTILYRYAQYKGKDVSRGENTNILSYDDFNEISEYAILAMQWAIEEGIITGRTTTTLAPQGIATRAEVATMIMRFSNMLSK